MANQTIVNPLGLIKDLKICIHGIPYTITFIVINSNVLDSSYSMLLVCYDIHFGILDEEEDMMFATKSNLFSIRTIVVPTHTKPISKLV
jgi:hypothetical protein